MKSPAGVAKGPTATKIVYSIRSRESLEINLADLTIDGRLEISPHVSDKGLLFLRFKGSHLVLSAGPYIGLIPLTPQVSIDVRPKLPVSNLAHVLDTARKSLFSITAADRLYLENALNNSSVLEFLAANLLDSLRPLAVQGLHKEYVRRSELTSHPRGRIELAGTVHPWSRGQRHMVQAQRFEQTSDVAINRLIKAALQFVLERIKLGSERSRDLVRQANKTYLELPGTIGNLRSADYETSDAVIHTRGMPAARWYYYRPIEIALLILSNRGVSLQKSGYDLLLESFIMNFESLFEEYLRRVLRQQANSNMTVRDGNLEGKKSLFDDRKDPSAEPDIVLVWRPTGRTVIAEVKYKDRPDRSDLNQVITYALSYGTNRTVLVHQWSPGSPKGLSTVGTIRGIRIDTYAFDLEAADLNVEEKALADCLFALVRPPQITATAA